MNTQQLETFVQVAEHLNFARAAESLNITQSAVSRQIHSLEDELGIKLLHRTTRTVILTPEGLSFLEDSKYILGRLKFATAKIQHHTDSNIQILSIGCGNEMYLDYLYKILNICRREIPSFHPFLRVISHRSLLNLFYQGDIDILLGFKDDVPMKDEIIFTELFLVPLCCALPIGHKYADQKFINTQNLLSEKLVTCNSFAIPLKAAERQRRLAEYLPPASVYNCESLHAALTLIRSGYGYSILPKARFDDPFIRYIPLENSDLMHYGIFYKKSASNPLLKKVVSIVKNNLF